MNQESGDPREREAKKSNLELIARRVDKETDGIGREIDPGIKETVVMFNAFGLKTVQSCEGGPLEDHGRQTPWVSFGPEDPPIKNWQKDDKLVEKQWQKTFEMRSKAFVLLNEFYKDRRVAYDQQLIIDDGPEHMRRIENQGMHEFENFSSDEQNVKKKLYKREMEAFTEFLRQKYLVE